MKDTLKLCITITDLSLLDLHPLPRRRSLRFLQWIPWWHSWAPKDIFNNMLITMDIKYLILHLLLWVLSIVSQAYQSLFGNIDGMMCPRFLFFSIYHSFSSSKFHFLKNSLLDYPPPHGGAPPGYGGTPSRVWWSVMLSSTSSLSF
jgi:hypothetical protein